MSEERLQEIKDSVDFQREMLLVHNLGTLCVDEEQELIDEIERLKEEYIMLQNAGDEVEEEKDREIERLNNIINQAIEYIENKNKYLDRENYYQVFEYRDIYLIPLLDILKGVDKE